MESDDEAPCSLMNTQSKSNVQYRALSPGTVEILTSDSDENLLNLGRGQSQDHHNSTMQNSYDYKQEGRQIAYNPYKNPGCPQDQFTKSTSHQVNMKRNLQIDYEQQFYQGTKNAKFQTSSHMASQRDQEWIPPKHVATANFLQRQQKQQFEATHVRHQQSSL